MKFTAIALLAASTQAVHLGHQAHTLKLAQAKMGNIMKSALAQARAGCPSSDEIEQVLGMIDADGSGTISWDEVKGFVNGNCPQHFECPTPEQMEWAHGEFQRVDSNDDGEVDIAEIEAEMENHGC